MLKLNYNLLNDNNKILENYNETKKNSKKLEEVKVNTDINLEKKSSKKLEEVKVNTDKKDLEESSKKLEDVKVNTDDNLDNKDLKNEIKDNIEVKYEECDIKKMDNSDENLYKKIILLIKIFLNIIKKIYKLSPINILKNLYNTIKYFMSNR